MLNVKQIVERAHVGFPNAKGDDMLALVLRISQLDRLASTRLSENNALKDRISELEYIIEGILE